MTTRAIRCDFSTMSELDWLRDRPEGGYQVILADPPWRFSSNSAARPGKNAMRHYSTMKLAQIEAMPVKAIAAPHALLLMWVTAPFAHLAFRVIEAWGFRYASQLVWPKNTIAHGYWAKGQHELVYIARRGKFPCDRPALFPRSVIPGKTAGHSVKPDWLHDVLDTRHPHASKVELFARRPRQGWTVMGNEVGEAAA